MSSQILEPAPPRPHVVATAGPPTASYALISICRCGHEADAHEHYRAGADCSVCGLVRCRRYAADRRTDQR